MSSKDIKTIQAEVDDYGVNHWLANNVRLNLFTKPWHKPRLEAVLANVTGEEILDIACATGELTNEIRKHANPKRIIGLEGCLAVVEEARKLYPEVIFEHGLVQEMNYPEKSFDAIHAGEIIEHIDDPFAFVERLARITRESAVVTTPTEVVNDPGHVAIFTEAGLKNVLEHGFCDVRIIDAGRTFVGVCHGPKF
ncbi:MAG: class I SAM-dependent methyltransferase [Deltaproteobacteria bacterium]|nr:class I SAM-dependent methyltransferase [Deltaproteobacteria bacterium]